MKKHCGLVIVLILVSLSLFACGPKEVTYRLAVEIRGTGTVYPVDGLFARNTSIDFVVEPADGWTLVRWSGRHGADVKKNGNRWFLLMNSHKEVIAEFEEIKANEISGEITIEHDWPNPYEELLEGAKKTNNSQSKQRVASGTPLEVFQKQEGNYVPEQLIVGFKRNVNFSEQLDLLNKKEYKVLKSISSINAHLLEVTQAELSSCLASLGEESSLAYIEPNYYVHASSIFPNDPMFSEQWHYPQIRLPQAWEVTKGASWVRIAVLDTGIDANHPDLAGKIDVDSGYNFYGNNDDTSDLCGHGTHVAGTIGAVTNNSLGVAGVMWEGTIIPVKVLGDDGSSCLFTVAQGVLYAAGLLTERPLANPAHVLNMSLGSPYSDEQALRDACQAASEAGVIIVAAAGNSSSYINNPASYPEVIAVGAVDYNYPDAPKKTSYSCYGWNLDLVAPGGDSRVDSDNDGNMDGVLSTYIEKVQEDGKRIYAEGEGFYKYSTGTSMACPHVVGVIGLMLANGIPPEDVREVLQRTAMDLGDKGFDMYYGHGLLNAYWAVSDVREIKLMVGERIGNRIEAVAETRVSLLPAVIPYSLKEIPQGEYSVFAWVDVQDNDIIEPGDYLAESPLINFGNGQILNLNLLLQEVKE